LKKIDETGDEGSGDTTTVDLQTHLEASLKMSQVLPVSLIKLFFFSGEKQNFWFWYCPPESAGLSVFLNYWMTDEKNFAVHTFLMLSVCFLQHYLLLLCLSMYM